MTDGETAIMKELSGLRGDVNSLRDEIGGPDGLRERIRGVEDKIPKQPCSMLETKLALDAAKEKADEATRNRVWDVVRGFMSPAALIAALVAMIKAYKPS